MGTEGTWPAHQDDGKTRKDCGCVEKEEMIDIRISSIIVDDDIVVEGSYESQR